MKKVIYKITKTKYVLVEVETQKEEEMIKELNRDLDREEKRVKSANRKNVSLDHLFYLHGFEPIDNSLLPPDKYNQEHEREELRSLLQKEIENLSARQKEIIFLFFFKINHRRKSLTN